MYNLKHWMLAALLLLSMNSLNSQTAEYDLFSYTPPAGWEKTTTDGSVTYAKVDKKTSNWCQLILCRKVNSTGTDKGDFQAEWDELILRNYKGSGTPVQTAARETKGWKVLTGNGKWIFNKKEVTTLLTTYSGFGVRASIVCNTTSPSFLPELEKLLKGLVLKKDKIVTNTPESLKTGKLSNASGYFFTRTNFDDGWVSTVQENWVEVTKGQIKVKIHYPDSKADQYNSVLQNEDLNAWNILVTPYYKQISQFSWKSIQSYESISFMEADAVEISSGQLKHIVLFKKHYSNGNGRYLEFVTASRAELENEFGPYHNTGFDWDKYAGMQFRNKFAIAAGDLKGNWTSDDYASLTYYYVSNGATAGTTATSSSYLFTFLTGNRYTSEYAGASGQVGNMKFSTQQYEGKSTVTDWKIVLTNRFKGATEEYEARFEAIKGGRILIMTDRLGTQLSLVKK